MAIREARWDCQYCGTKGILGRHKSCTNCGRSRPEGTKFYLSDDAAVIVEKKLEDQARIGPDWVCQFCGTSNSSDATVCRSCNAPREASSPEQQLKDYKPGQAPTTGDMTLEPKPRDPSKSPTPAATRAGSRLSLKAIIGVAGAALLLCLCAIAAIAIFGGKDVNATVSAFSWERSVEVETFRTVVEEDWSVPSDGRILDQRQEIHHSEQVLVRYETRERQVAEQVQVGERTYVCGQRDLGNGFFEDIECSEPVFETQYRTETYQEPIYVSEPVYQAKYTYEIDRWVTDRTEKAAGEDHSPVWPSPQLADNEREGRRTEVYTVFFSDSDSKTYSQEMTLDDWFSYELGQGVTLKLDAVGNLQEIER